MGLGRIIKRSKARKQDRVQDFSRAKLVESQSFHKKKIFAALVLAGLPLFGNALPSASAEEDPKEEQPLIKGLDTNEKHFWLSSQHVHELEGIPGTVSRREIQDFLTWRDAFVLDVVSNNKWDTVITISEVAKYYERYGSNHYRFGLREAVRVEERLRAARGEDSIYRIPSKNSRATDFLGDMGGIFATGRGKVSRAGGRISSGSTALGRFFKYLEDNPEPLTRELAERTRIDFYDQSALYDKARDLLNLENLYKIYSRAQSDKNFGLFAEKYLSKKTSSSITGGAKQNLERSPLLKVVSEIQQELGDRLSSEEEFKAYVIARLAKMQVQIEELSEKKLVDPNNASTPVNSTPPQPGSSAVKPELDQNKIDFKSHWKKAEATRVWLQAAVLTGQDVLDDGQMETLQDMYVVVDSVQSIIEVASEFSKSDGLDVDSLIASGNIYVIGLKLAMHFLNKGKKKPDPNEMIMKALQGISKQITRVHKSINKLRKENYRQYRALDKKISQLAQVIENNFDGVFKYLRAIKRDTRSLINGQGLTHTILGDIGVKIDDLETKIKSYFTAEALARFEEADRKHLLLRSRSSETPKDHTKEVWEQGLSTYFDYATKDARRVPILPSQVTETELGLKDPKKRRAYILGSKLSLETSYLSAGRDLDNLARLVQAEFGSSDLLPNGGRHRDPNAWVLFARKLLDYYEDWPEFHGEVPLVLQDLEFSGRELLRTLDSIVASPEVQNGAAMSLSMGAAISKYKEAVQEVNRELERAKLNFEYRSLGGMDLDTLTLPPGLRERDFPLEYLTGKTDFSESSLEARVAKKPFIDKETLVASFYRSFDRNNGRRVTLTPGSYKREEVSEELSLVLPTTENFPDWLHDLFDRTLAVSFVNGRPALDINLKTQLSGRRSHSTTSVTQYWANYSGHVPVERGFLPNSSSESIKMNGIVAQKKYVYTFDDMTVLVLIDLKPKGGEGVWTNARKFSLSLNCPDIMVKLDTSTERVKPYVPITFGPYENKREGQGLREAAVEKALKELRVEGPKYRVQEKDYYDRKDREKYFKDKAQKISYQDFLKGRLEEGIPRTAPFGKDIFNYDSEGKTWRLDLPQNTFDAWNKSIAELGAKKRKQFYQELSRVVSAVGSERAPAARNFRHLSAETVERLHTSFQKLEARLKLIRILSVLGAGDDLRDDRNLNQILFDASNNLAAPSMEKLRVTLLEPQDDSLAWTLRQTLFRPNALEQVLLGYTTKRTQVPNSSSLFERYPEVVQVVERAAELIKASSKKGVKSSNQALSVWERYKNLKSGQKLPLPENISAANKGDFYLGNSNLEIAAVLNDERFSPAQRFNYLLDILSIAAGKKPSLEMIPGLNDWEQVAGEFLRSLRVYGGTPDSSAKINELLEDRDRLLEVIKQISYMDSFGSSVVTSNAINLLGRNVSQAREMLKQDFIKFYEGISFRANPQGGGNSMWEYEVKSTVKEAIKILKSELDGSVYVPTKPWLSAKTAKESEYIITKTDEMLLRTAIRRYKASVQVFAASLEMLYPLDYFLSGGIDSLQIFPELLYDHLLKAVITEDFPKDWGYSKDLSWPALEDGFLLASDENMLIELTVNDLSKNISNGTFGSLRYQRLVSTLLSLQDSSISRAASAASSLEEVKGLVDSWSGIDKDSLNKLWQEFSKIDTKDLHSLGVKLYETFSNSKISDLEKVVIANIVANRFFASKSVELPNVNLSKWEETAEQVMAMLDTLEDVPQEEAKSLLEALIEEGETLRDAYATGYSVSAEKIDLDPEQIKKIFEFHHAAFLDLNQQIGSFLNNKLADYKEPEKKKARALQWTKDLIRITGDLVNATTTPRPESAIISEIAEKPIIEKFKALQGAKDFLSFCLTARYAFESEGSQLINALTVGSPFERLKDISAFHEIFNLDRNALELVTPSSDLRYPMYRPPVANSTVLTTQRGIPFGIPYGERMLKTLDAGQGLKAKLDHNRGLLLEQLKSRLESFKD